MEYLTVMDITLSTTPQLTLTFNIPSLLPCPNLLLPLLLNPSPLNPPPQHPQLNLK